MSVYPFLWDYKYWNYRYWDNSYWTTQCSYLYLWSIRLEGSMYHWHNMGLDVC
ncbi:hypothetical protein DPMN_012231 [Dreissena polymorpha]|uniref:Uncharacterized protein n=1 Tax=Dreissena polymorpha TaxID=45954 RepID=A0A9D4N320_DREPO|nr:hypothetical protein DPMN_012231 [Dreissena polymorpha]